MGCSLSEDIAITLFVDIFASPISPCIALAIAKGEIFEKFGPHSLGSSTRNLGQIESDVPLSFVCCLLCSWLLIIRCLLVATFSEFRGSIGVFFMFRRLYSPPTMESNKGTLIGGGYAAPHCQGYTDVILKV